MIRPWVFEFFPAPREPGATIDPQRSADYFNWYLDLWPRAELLGYEGIFFSAHHFRAQPADRAGRVEDADDPIGRHGPRQNASICRDA